jgi:hypothetical protein
MQEIIAVTVACLAAMAIRFATLVLSILSLGMTLIPPIMIMIMIRLDYAAGHQETACNQRVKRKLHDKPHDFWPSTPLQFNAWLPW